MLCHSFWSHPSHDIFDPLFSSSPLSVILKNQKYNAMAAALKEPKSLSSYINNRSHTTDTHTNANNTNLDTERIIKRHAFTIFPFSCYCFIPQCNALQRRRTWALFIKTTHCQGETKNNEKLSRFEPNLSPWTLYVFMQNVTGRKQLDCCFAFLSLQKLAIKLAGAANVFLIRAHL